MKTISLSLLLISLSLAFFSCDDGNVKSSLSPYDSLVKRIDSLEQKIEANKMSNLLDQKLAKSAIDAYQRFATTFKNDTMAPWYLFKAADLSSSALGMHQQGLAYYDIIITDYPKFPKYPETLFLAGFICQDKMQKGVEAKQYYDRLIKEFPKHEFVDDAQAMISFFGKSDEEIVREFEKRNENKMNK